MCNMQELHLHYNPIGVAGLSALADALGKGALPQLETLLLDRTEIGDIGISALSASARAGGALSKLVALQLNFNEIGDTGMSALASACMSQLTTLHLGWNEIGDVGMSALASDCTSGALGKLQVRWRPSAL